VDGNSKISSSNLLVGRSFFDWSQAVNLVPLNETYKNVKEVKTAWNAGKNFQTSGVNNPYWGSVYNKNTCPTTEVFIHYSPKKSPVKINLSS